MFEKLRISWQIYPLHFISGAKLSLDSHFFQTRRLRENGNLECQNLLFSLLPSSHGFTWSAEAKVYLRSKIQKLIPITSMIAINLKFYISFREKFAWNLEVVGSRPKLPCRSEFGFDLWFIVVVFRKFSECELQPSDVIAPILMSFHGTSTLR